MSEIGIILVSVLCGAFALGMVAAMAALIWISLSLRRQLIEAQAENLRVQADSKSAIASIQQETKSSLDAARASFAQIRTEMKNLLEEHRKKADRQLDDHRKEMKSAIATINAEALTAAATRSIDSCNRLEKAISVFQRLILENTEQRSMNEYAPEEAAPESGNFSGPPSGYSVSLTSRLDDEAEEQQASLFESGAE